MDGYDIAPVGLAVDPNYSQSQYRPIGGCLRGNFWVVLCRFRGVWFPRIARNPDFSFGRRVGTIARIRADRLRQGEASDDGMTNLLQVANGLVRESIPHPADRHRSLPPSG